MPDFRTQEKMNYLNERRDRRISDASNKKMMLVVVLSIVSIIALMVVAMLW